MAPGLTFDTGALIGLETRGHRMRKRFDAAVHDGLAITVPTAVLTEWWRGGRGAKLRTLILRSVRCEPLDERTAKLAGEAVASVAGATPIDAIVMASAALRGDIVCTSDMPDLERLRAFFPTVRLIAV
jgi:predicted nucleic acid-binding protein